MNKKTKSLSLISFSFPILINALQVISTWIPQESWYLEWGKYVYEGQLPYKDFYIPFPPLLVYINSLFYFTSNPLIVSHVFYLISMGFLGWGLFKVSARITDKKISLMISTSLILFWSIHPTDVIGGYFEFAVTLVTWGYYLVFQKIRHRYLQIVGGALIAMGSLVKQNFLATVIALTFYFLVQILFQKKNCSRIKHALIGAYSTYLLLTLILISNNSFILFLNAMLDGGGKNPKLTTWMINLIISNLRPSVFLACVLLLSGFFVISRFTFLPKMNSQNFIFLLFGSSLISASFSIFSNFSFEIISIKNILQTMFLFCLVVILAQFQPKLNFLSYCLVGLITFSILHIYLDFFASQFGIKSNLELINTNYVYSMWRYLGATVWFFITTVIVISLFSLSRFVKSQFFSKFVIPSQFRVVVVSLFAADLLNAFNGGLALDGSILLASIVLSVLSINVNLNGLITRLIIFLLSIGLILSSAIISRINYQWYYWNEVKTLNVSNSVPLLRGMHLTTTQTKFYEEIEKQLILGSNILNNSKPIVISIPAQPTLSWLHSGFYENSYYLRCPVIWIDICPEDEAERTFVQIQRNAPDIIIFFDLGTKALVDLELGYRNGDVSTLSEIRKYLLYGTNYRILKTIKTAGNSSETFILVKKE